MFIAACRLTVVFTVEKLRVYVKVRYEGGESGKMGQSLREREGLRKEHWYLAEQPV